MDLGQFSADYLQTGVQVNLFWCFRVGRRVGERASALVAWDKRKTERVQIWW